MVPYSIPYLFEFYTSECVVDREVPPHLLGIVEGMDEASDKRPDDLGVPFG